MGVSLAKLIIYNIVLLFICHNKRSSSSSSSVLILWPVCLLHDNMYIIHIHHGECMLQNPCFVDNIKLRRHVFKGLSLFGFDFVLMFCISLAFQVWFVSTREIGTQSQCMLLIDPDDDDVMRRNMIERTR